MLNKKTLTIPTRIASQSYQNIFIKMILNNQLLN